MIEIGFGKVLALYVTVLLGLPAGVSVTYQTVESPNRLVCCFCFYNSDCKYSGGLRATPTFIALLIETF